VAHPRMYDEDDPYLAEVRRIALAFPEAVEVEAWGKADVTGGQEDVHRVRR
jgi:hypothetical protein